MPQSNNRRQASLPKWECPIHLGDAEECVTRIISSQALGNHASVLEHPQHSSWLLLSFLCLSMILCQLDNSLELELVW